MCSNFFLICECLWLRNNLFAMQTNCGWKKTNNQPVIVCRHRIIEYFHIAVHGSSSFIYFINNAIGPIRGAIVFTKTISFSHSLNLNPSFNPMYLNTEKLLFFDRIFKNVIFCVKGGSYKGRLGNCHLRL